MFAMTVIALVVSGLSLVVAGLGTYLSNKRASEAIEEARKAADAVLWTGAQEAIQRLIGFDPASEPVAERLTNLRISMITLVDELDGWDDFDQWLEAERVLGTTLGRQVMERASPQDTVDDRLAILDPYQRWAQLFGHNLRHFRNEWYNADTVWELRGHASDEVRRVCDANGWPLPPTTIPGLRQVGD